MTGRLRTKPPEDPGPRLGKPLTEHEVEVLWLVTDGLSNEAIAKRIGRSPYTVKFHLGNAAAKLGTRSRTRAAVDFVLSRPEEALARRRQDLPQKTP